jgi:hypothetical protein
MTAAGEDREFYETVGEAVSATVFPSDRFT